MGRNRMANMGYCRFQNTLGDLNDCLDALHEGKELSPEEARAAKKLIDLAKRIAGYTAEDIDGLTPCEDCEKTGRTLTNGGTYADPFYVCDDCKAEMQKEKKAE